MLAIVKRSGIRVPTEFSLRKYIAYYNKNMGFAYARNGKIIINKNFNNANDFLSSWNVANISVDDSVFLFFDNDNKNVDPIPLTNRKELMKFDLVECQCQVWMHDGELNYNEDTNSFSDFVAKVYDIDIDRFKTIVNMCFNSSKIAILHTDKEMELFGTWHNDAGLLYSNYIYKKSIKKLTKMSKKKK